MQGISDNSINYTLKSSTLKLNIIDDNIRLRQETTFNITFLSIYCPLSRLHYISLFYSSENTQLILENLQGLLTVALIEGDLGGKPQQPAKQLNGNAVNTFRTRRT